MKLGSLFDGAGTFPFAAKQYGIQAVMKRRDCKTPNYVCFPQNRKWVVRRVVTIECARLQGMPDWWCNDIPHSDSAEYKMWGNGMALPCAMYVMEGIAKVLKKKEELEI